MPAPVQVHSVCTVSRTPSCSTCFGSNSLAVMLTLALLFVQDFVAHPAVSRLLHNGNIFQVGCAVLYGLESAANNGQMLTQASNNGKGSMSQQHAEPCVRTSTCCCKGEKMYSSLIQSTKNMLDISSWPCLGRQVTSLPCFSCCTLLELRLTPGSAL